MRSILALAITAALAGCAPDRPEVDRLDCAGCHDSLFDTAPDHVAGGYPHTCYTCHGLTAWQPAVTEHDAFRIRSGAHAGWDCADCHEAITYDPPEVTDPAQITCIDCHAHVRERVDPYHLGNSRYSYGEDTCLECHRRGGGG